MRTRLHRHQRRLAIALLLVAAPRDAAYGQSGSLVVTLGADTVQVESYRRTSLRLEGTVVTRTPRTRVVRYAFTFGPDGRPDRYEFGTFLPDGAPIARDGSEGSMTLRPDTVTRESLRAGVRVSERIAAPEGVLPGPSLPYLGLTFKLYELAVVRARDAAVGGRTGTSHLLSTVPALRGISRRQFRFVGTDSAEMDYFGVAQVGFKFTAAGELERSDWTGTTYRYRVTRTTELDVERIAREWAAGEATGKVMGPLSFRDTVEAEVGGAHVGIIYSRPAQRGRAIWGALVPWDQVWRFGADVATHLTTTAELRIGDTVVPAGRYTLWMRPSADGTAALIVNRQVNIFGTAYDASFDAYRIPMRRSSVASPVERFTIAIEDSLLWARWGDAGWSVRITASGSP